eukprot:4283592-Prymnesium_polylepis.1
MLSKGTLALPLSAVALAFLGAPWLLLAAACSASIVIVPSPLESAADCGSCVAPPTPTVASDVVSTATRAAATAAATAARAAA